MASGFMNIYVWNYFMIKAKLNDDYIRVQIIECMIAR